MGTNIGISTTRSIISHMKSIQLGIVLLFLSASPTLAHSGRTDASGGHNCRVGACAGTYHYHNGGTYRAPAVVYTPAPTRKITPTPTRTYTPTPTRKVTPTTQVLGDSSSSSDFEGLLTVLGIGGGIWYLSSRGRKKDGTHP